MYTLRWQVYPRAANVWPRGNATIGFAYKGLLPGGFSSELRSDSRALGAGDLSWKRYPLTANTATTHRARGPEAIFAPAPIERFERRERWRDLLTRAAPEWLQRGFFPISVALQSALQLQTRHMRGATRSAASACSLAGASS